MLTHHNGISALAAELARDCGLPAERRLWLAVLGEAIANDKPDDVRHWLRSRDGREVCALAGVEPEWIIWRFIGERVPRRKSYGIARAKGAGPRGIAEISRGAFKHSGGDHATAA